MTKNRTPTPVYLDPGMHPGLEVKGLMILITSLFGYVCRKNLFCGKLHRSPSTHHLVHPLTPAVFEVQLVGLRLKVCAYLPVI